MEVPVLHACLEVIDVSRSLSWGAVYGVCHVASHTTARCIVGPLSVGSVMNFYHI